MMKTTKILLALTLVMTLVLAVHLYRGEGNASVIGELVFPELKAELNRVVRVNVRSSAGETIMVAEAGGWKVQQRAGYSADFLKLSEFLNGLARAKYQEKKTAKAANHEQLGLLSVGREAGSGVEVTVVSDSDQQWDIMLGNASAHLEGMYFRFPGQDQVWLMDQDLEITAEPASWLDHIIIDVPDQDVERVVQTTYGAESYVLVRDGSERGNLLIESVPEGKKMLYPTVANEFGRALVNLRMKDVAVQDITDWSEANRTDFECQNNLQLTVWSLEHSDRYFLKLSAQPRDVESEDVAVKELAARLQPWVFEVGRITYQQFNKELSDLLVDNSSEVNES
jgi:hypothetical protein